MKSSLNSEYLYYIIMRYKLLHIFFWTIIVSINFFIYYDSGQTPFINLFDNVYLVLGSFIPFYLTPYFVLPQYLYKNKYGWYFIIIVLLAVQMTVFYILCNDIIYYKYYQIEKPFFIYFISEIFGRRFAIIFWTYLIPLLCGSTIKVMSDRFRSETRLIKIKQDQLATELNALRSQIHPHFLFNVMNTIYFQISKENRKARRLVELASDMLRYQLYESNGKMVSIKEEINYLNNYLEVAEYKGIKPSQIVLNVDKNILHRQIAPQILSPLVECALKYLQKYNQVLHIHLSESDNKIVFLINTSDDLIPNDIESYKNWDEYIAGVKRRLDILYDNRYILDYFQDKYQLYIKLILKNGAD